MELNTNLQWDVPWSQQRYPAEDVEDGNRFSYGEPYTGPARGNAAALSPTEVELLTVTLTPTLTLTLNS